MKSVRRGLSVALALGLVPGAPLLLTPATGWSQIEEIVVTTRKREEGLQDVPLAINAISADEIERKNISNIEDAVRELTSVQFDEGASQSDTRITVRGLSPTRGRQNVAVLVDGIDLSTEAISSSGGGILLNTRLVDVERIEVVKGPQMVLYGRSAFAGAIQYVTRDPSAFFDVDFRGDANLEDRYSAGLSVSGPVLGDKLGLRFNAAWWDEQGFYDNALTGKSLGDNEGYGLALSAKSQVTDTFTVRFRAEYQDQEIGPTPTAFLKFNQETLHPESATTPQTLTDPVSGISQTYAPIFDCFENLSSFTYDRDVLANGTSLLDARNARLYSITPGGPPDAAFPNVLYASPYCETAVANFGGAAKNFQESDVIVSNNPFTGRDYKGIDRQLYRFALIMDWELERGTLTSRTGFVNEDAKENSDNGKFAFAATEFSPLTGGVFLNGNPNAFILDTDKTTQQFSQELMFRTNYDGPVQVSVGGLYWQEDVDNDSDSLTLQASGSHCSWITAARIPFDLNNSGIDTACYGYTERPIEPLIRGGFFFGNGVDFYDGIQPIIDRDGPSPADRNTKHRSVFGMFEFEVTQDWRITFEGRYSIESVDVVGPRFLDPLASGGPGSWNPCGFFFRPCTDDFMFGPTGPFYSWENFTQPVVGQLVNNANTTGGYGYDVWAPNYVYSATGSAVPSLLALGYQLQPGAQTFTYRETIPAECLADPAVQARLAAYDAGEPDQFDMFNPYCVARISRDDKWLAPKIILDWQVNDDIKTYFSWSRAEKPGGFSTLTFGSSGLDRELAEFEPEKLTVWEVGAKTRWLDGTLVVNGATFFQDFAEKQTLVSVLNRAGDRLVNKLENVCCAEVWGVEVDATWAPMSSFLGGNWIVRGAYTWLDAEYVGAQVDNNSFTFISAVGNCEPKLVVRGVSDGSPDRVTTGPFRDLDDVVICGVSLDGKKLEDAPRGRFAGSLAYNRPLNSGLNLIAELDFQWSAKRYIEATNENWVESDTNTDFRLGVQSGQWEVFGYVNNVFDDDTIYSVLGGPSLSCCFILGSGLDIVTQPPSAREPFPTAKTVIVELPQFRAAFAPDPRVIGLRFRYRFGGFQ